LILNLGDQVKFRLILEAIDHVFQDQIEHQSERWDDGEANPSPVESAGNRAARRLHGIGRPLDLGTFVRAQGRGETGGA
jgi:hypothetical protein